MTSPTVSFTPCPLACLILRSDSRSSCSLIELLKLRHRGWIDEQCYRIQRWAPRHEDFTHFNGFSPSDPMDPVFAKNPFEGRWVLPPCVSCSSWQKLQLKPLRHPSPKWIKRHGWPWRGQTGKNMYIEKVKITSNKSYKNIYIYDYTYHLTSKLAALTKDVIGLPHFAFLSIDIFDTKSRWSFLDLFASIIGAGSLQIVSIPPNRTQDATGSSYCKHRYETSQRVGSHPTLCDILSTRYQKRVWSCNFAKQVNINCN